MEQYHTLPFQLILGVRIIFWLVEWALRTMGIASVRFIFVWLGQGGKSNSQNQEKWNGKTNSGYCAAVTFYFLGKGVEFVSSRMQRYVLNVGASAEI